MHHLVFDELVKELAKAAERGVRVRVIVNATDRAEAAGAAWTRLSAAGGELRFKQTNGDLYQLMHHKLMVVDDRVVVNGSGNWSGSAFFKNFENYVRYRDPRIARPYRELYDRLWLWSLSGASLDAGLTAAQQHAADTDVFFGNLHAHYAADATGAALDDGKAIRKNAAGEMVPVDVGATPSDAARYAYEYARDEGGLDFLALTPHTTSAGALDASDNANMIPEQFEQMALVAKEVTRSSAGSFVAMAGMEWSTNSAGNHVNVFGSRELAKVDTGRFDLLFGEFLPGRESAGDAPLVQLNHPRTFRRIIVAAPPGYALTWFSTASARNGMSRWTADAAPITPSALSGSDVVVTDVPTKSALHADSVASPTVPWATGTSVAAAHEYGMPSWRSDATITEATPGVATHALPTMISGAGVSAVTVDERHPASTV